MIVTIGDRYGKLHHVNLQHIVEIEPDPNSDQFEKRCFVTLTNGNKIHAAHDHIQLVSDITGVKASA